MLGRVSATAAVSTASVDNLRVSWSDGVMAEGWRAVCGDVRNVGQLSARGVAIRVLGVGQHQPGDQHKGSLHPRRRAGGRSRGLLCVNARRGDFVRRHGSPCRLEIPGGTLGERSSRWWRRHARGADPTERAER
jgi:hypothetical protein